MRYINKLHFRQKNETLSKKMILMKYAHTYKNHSIHKLFNRVKFDYVAIQIEIILMILLFFKIDTISNFNR